MKIGICTCYHDNPNYGGQLQAFALQHILTEMGHDVLLIPYKLNLTKHRVRVFVHSSAPQLTRFFKERLSRRKWVADDHLRSLNARRLDMFRAFERSIPHCKLVDTAGLFNVADQFDAFIVGSDQVWNPEGWNPYYLLEFVPDTKIKLSYAASMVNRNLTQRESKRLHSALASYRGISLREPGAVPVVNSLMSPRRVPAQAHVDPTILLSGKAWEKALGIPEERFLSEPYAFIYFARKTSDEFRNAISWCRQRRIKPVVTTLGCPLDHEVIEAVAPYIDLPPSRWIHAVRDAEAVITDSFHGCSFAVNFDKPLCAITRGASGNDERIPHLLRMVGREDCITAGEDSIAVKPCSSPSSTSFVRERERSFSYLRGVLGDERHA